MSISAGEKLRLVLRRRGMTIAQLAERMNTSRQNISNKLARDNFTEQELRALCDALDCDCDITFTLRDSGEQI
ncbi:MAG: helix-turn-helix transcriptional regulator [Clostridia bacterium]|nr:helix-turn-helix transcriptional regulator [Clostridia bacterium]